MEEKKVTLNDITGDIKEVDISTKKNKKEVNTITDPTVADAMSALDKAIDRTKAELTDVRDAAMAEAEKQALEASEAEEKAKETQPVSNIDVDILKGAEDEVKSETAGKFDFLISDEDLDEDQEVATDEDKANFEALKADIRQNLKPINNVIDFANFKISKKPMGASKALTLSEVKKHVADWVLLTAQKSISISEFSGSEIEKFNPNNTSRNRINTYKDMYSIIYNHLVDANKPGNLEAWTKTINFFDIDHIYFAIYRACFEGSNYIPYTCPKCKKTFMKKVEIETMIKYASPEVKEKIAKILAKDTTSLDDYQIQPIQVSDNYVIGLRLPTVYNVIFENAALDEDFSSRYADLLGVLSYIDEIYYIDREKEELVVIDTMPDVTDFVKTVKRKIKAYNEIFKTLTPDQYNNIAISIKAINDRGEGISYIIPETDCEQCQTHISEKETDPLTLIFTRHQLVAIANL